MTEVLRLPGPQSQPCHLSHSVTSDKWLKHSLPLSLIFEVVIKPRRKSGHIPGHQRMYSENEVCFVLSRVNKCF